MKKLIFGITLCCITCFCLNAGAQSIKKKGYIVLNNGDSLHGWINYYNWERNPSTIKFTKDSTSNVFTSFGKNDIRYVQVNNLDRYLKAVVVKDTRPVQMDELLLSDNDSFITDTVLLRVLVKGSKFDLYELNDSKPHFYIKENGRDFKELSYSVRLSDDNTAMKINRGYINELKSYLSNQLISSNLINKINEADYKEKDLAAIVTEMNNISGTVEYTAQKQQKKILTSFFIGAGGCYGNLKYDGSNSVFMNKQIAGGFVPYVAAGIEITSSRNLQALAIRIEAGFSHGSYTAQNKNNTSGNTSRYDISQTNFTPTFTLLFNLIRKETMRVYLGGGIGWNISNYGKNVYTQTYTNGIVKNNQDYYTFSKNWVTPIFKLGVKLNSRMSVEADGRFLGPMTNYISWSLTPQTFTGQFRYYF